jgi:hypothetical protein
VTLALLFVYPCRDPASVGSGYRIRKNIGVSVMGKASATVKCLMLSLSEVAAGLAFLFPPAGFAVDSVVGIMELEQERRDR